MEMNFREFLTGAAPVGHDTTPQSWRMDKDQIRQYWQTLRPDGPIQFDAMEPGQKGSTFGEDGLRLTGSRKFIDSVLGRLKDIMQYENPATKLNLVYRQVQYKGSQTPDKNTSFVFYAQVKKREKPNTPGAPHGSSNPAAAGPAIGPGPVA